MVKRCFVFQPARVPGNLGLVGVETKDLSMAQSCFRRHLELCTHEEAKGKANLRLGDITYAQVRRVRSICRGGN